MSHRPDRILLFGGTFDPPHRAHTELPPLVADQLDCDRLIYIPTSANPLKDDRPTDARHRLKMLRLAIESVPGAEIDPVELEQAGPSYTVNTLRALRERYGPEVDLRLLIGSDQAANFHRWHEARTILQLARPAVMLRPPADHESLRRDLSDHWSEKEVADWLRCAVEVPEVAVSATEIRRRLQAGEPVDDLLAPAVADYIRRHGLYGAAARQASSRR